MSRYALSLLLVASTFSLQNVYGETSAEPEKYFTQLYEKTCLNNAADMSVLKTRFAEAKVPKLVDNKAVLFLEKKPGSVWVIPNVIGNYLVSIDDSLTCSVYTHSVKINEIERQFIELLERTPLSFVLEKMQDETKQTELGPKHFISFMRTNRTDSTKQKFTLITSNSDRVEVQVKATVEIVQP
ncbi:MAG: hypothetical protein V7784_00915 [Oceanospirillaceae bacterium]